ncbi:urate hydroxylase PuuD [Flavobacterium sedimenticola]|uniref:Urate hydroxylase PuuD n=1 Tax=Flavobacterium sedimenticola TaxID=3043286 RepID=A0ABT6XRA1_9FLAO|nr:urate hydroxylase PuuD [Flavobacterium sedimenticola]MDI9257619.1 urate hydroxylase PuuD [Flavobacterium sedimenticola]
MNTFILSILYVIYFSVLITLGYISYKMPKIKVSKADDDTEETQEIKKTSQNYIYTGILLAIVGILVNTYFLVEGTPLESHMMEWLNIVIRLMHITFGIAWIGASFYFVFLENALNRTEEVRDELAGNLWAVHGGGFYYLEKYKIAPKTIPKRLHWFKYEAYFTWLSGFCLLFVVYYFNASAFLIDKNVFDITVTQAILTGVGSFVVAWLIYDQMCKSALIRNQVAFALVGFALLVGFAWFYCHVFSARAAYIHFGAMIGSLMVANVFFVIIPAQKAMVAAGKLGQPLDPTLGKKALARSLHNNYFTLPVLFVMVSNHFPSTFGYEYPWLMLAIISLGAAGVKHYLNLKEKKQLNVWILPVSVVILLSACFISAPSTNPNACKEEVTITQVQEIIQKRCTQCHSSSPTDDTYKVAPNGVMYDTPEDIVKKKDLIMQRVVITKTMPQNNKTNMTDEERNLIRCWIEQGASLK